MTAAAVSWAPLVGAALAYTASNLLLSAGSTGTTVAGALRNRAYLAGTALQGVGFLASVLARRELPLLVVQSGITVAVALTAVGGALLGRWRLGVVQLAGVTAVVAGLALAAASAEAGPARDPGPAVLLTGLVALAVALTAGRSGALTRAGVPPTWWPATRGALSGVGFGVSAIGSRVALGDALGDLTPRGLLHLATTAVGLLSALLVVGGVLAGQVLLTAALTSGAVTGPVAVMHVVENAGPAAVGLAFLGDRLVAGGGLPAALGVALATAGSFVLAGEHPHRRDYARMPPILRR